MDFIQSSNKAADLFGAGKHGFSAGNPTSGVLATFFTAVWANNLQQEVVNAIEGAGITINPAVQNQLLAAIQALVLAPFSGANQSLGANGFQKLPAGLILQWGSAGTLDTPGADSVVTFPIAFPTAARAVFATFSEAAAPFDDVTTPIFVTGKTATNFTVRNYTGAGNGFSYWAIGH